MSSDELTHYGVEGMRWGVRHDREGVHRTSIGSINIEPGFHSGTKKAAIEVSNLMRERYGYNIRNIKVLGPDMPEYPDTAAYVENNRKNNGLNEGTIFVQTRDLSKQLHEAEKVGWFGEGMGNTRGLLTHESAHSMFHADEKVKGGIFTPERIVGGNVKARDKALRAALKVARNDKVSIMDVSGYAQAAGVKQELEAEMFSQYHWSPNPPRFVQAWGQTLHKELGVDPTPFKEVK